MKKLNGQSIELIVATIVFHSIDDSQCLFDILGGHSFPLEHGVGGEQLIHSQDPDWEQQAGWWY